MDEKKVTIEPKSWAFFEGEVKEEKGPNASLIVEGFANRAMRDGRPLVDRGGDVILPDAWLLDEFKMNPVIFFNHDRSFPIGKAIMVSKTNDGLFIRVKLSNDDHPEIKRIRTLVREGILRSFSVGFDPIEKEFQDIEGKQVNVIKRANLLETSIVSIPMAQESLFVMKTKELAEMSHAKAVKILTGKSEEPPKEDEPKEDEPAEDKSEEKPDQAEDQGAEDEKKADNCVKDKIRKLIDEGKPQDQAVAIAISYCREQGNKCDLSFSALRDILDEVAKDFEKSEAPQEEVQEKQDPTVAIPTTSSEHDPMFENPQIDAQKQTNVLLGALIREVQLLRSAMGDTPKPEAPDDEGGEEMQGSIDDAVNLSDNIKGDDFTRTYIKTMSGDKKQVKSSKLDLFDVYLKDIAKTKNKCDKIFKKLGV